MFRPIFGEFRSKKVPVTDDYRYDLDAMAEAISDRTKMIYIANPNNPTGTYITDSEFKRFMRRVPDDVLVVMDEAYFEYRTGCIRLSAFAWIMIMIM
ncbi:MAG: aminotransferase class I/II-fold pyridoxal phosphate-dependent enzyme [Fodinibius sp.]|nr:aminotransferase class I/II-fold pyridoxal phosphate-dependent enzyme [Fodinibius sp.]